MLVGAVVVDDEMQLELGRNANIEVPEEGEELLMAVPRLAWGDDFAALHIEGGEQRGRAVAQVVMRDAFEVAHAHRQDRLGALQGLDLALLVDAEDQRLVRRIEVEPHDIAHSIHEERVVRELEGFAAMRLQSEQPEKPMDGAVMRKSNSSQKVATLEWSLAHSGNG